MLLRLAFFALLFIAFFRSALALIGLYDSLNYVFFALLLSLALVIPQRIAKARWKLSSELFWGIISLSYVVAALLFSYLLSLGVSQVVTLKIAISYSCPIIIYSVLIRRPAPLLLQIDSIAMGFSYLLLAVAFIEVFVPVDILSGISTLIMLEKFGVDGLVQNAYLVREYGFATFGIHRLGSFVFEPLTLAFVSFLFLATSNKSKPRILDRTIGVIVIWLTQAKSAILALLLTYLTGRLRLLGIVLLAFLISAATLILLIVGVDGLENTSYLLHIKGYIYGIYGGLSHPFGNGIGTGSYFAYREAQKLGVVSQFFDTTITAGVSNGNESFIGSLLYQLGVLGAIAYVSPLMYLVLRFLRYRLYSGLALILGFCFASIVVESTSSTLIQILFGIRLCALYSEIPTQRR